MATGPDFTGLYDESHTSYSKPPTEYDTESEGFEGDETEFVENFVQRVSEPVKLTKENWLEKTLNDQLDTNEVTFASPQTRLDDASPIVPPRKSLSRETSPLLLLDERSPSPPRRGRKPAEVPRRPTQTDEVSVVDEGTIDLDRYNSETEEDESEMKRQLEKASMLRDLVEWNYKEYTNMKVTLRCSYNRVVEIHQFVRKCHKATVNKATMREAITMFFNVVVVMNEWGPIKKHTKIDLNPWPERLKHYMYTEKGLDEEISQLFINNNGESHFGPKTRIAGKLLTSFGIFLYEQHKLLTKKAEQDRKLANEMEEKHRLRTLEMNRAHDERVLQIETLAKQNTDQMQRILSQAEKQQETDMLLRKGLDEIMKEVRGMSATNSQAGLASPSSSISASQVVSRAQTQSPTEVISIPTSAAPGLSAIKAALKLPGEKEASLILELDNKIEDIPPSQTIEVGA